MRRRLRRDREDGRARTGEEHGVSVTEAGRRVRRRGVLGRVIVLAAALAVGGVLVSAGSAADPDDAYTYTANLCGQTQLLVTGDCPEPSTSAGLPGAGGSVDLYLTLRPSVVTVPGGEEPDGDEFVAFDSLTIGLPTGPAGLKYTAAAVTSGTVFSVTDSAVTLTGLGVPPEGLVTVKLTLDVPPCVSGLYDWSGADVIVPGGSDGGSITRTLDNNSLTATPAGCHLAMETQPKDTVKNQHISDALYSSGGSVKVGLRDNSGNALVNLNGSCSSGPGCVTATFSGGASSATLGGQTSQPFTGGVASFNDLSLNKASEDNYNLNFAAPPSTGVTGVQSDPFAITDAGTVCHSACSLPDTTIDGKTTSSVKSSGAGALGLTLLPGALPTGVCGGFSPAAGSDGVFINVTAPGNGSVTEVTIRLDKSIVQASPDNGAAHYNVCFGGIIPSSPATPFTTKTGTPAAQFVGGLWWGILPDCKGKLTQPCVAKRNKNNGDVVIVFDVPAPWDLRGYGG